MRSLESASIAGSIAPHVGETDIFIYPGYQFRSVDALITNFHLPESTLMMLVSAFAGKDHIMEAYAQAVKEQYRFFSYGDSMFIHQIHPHSSLKESKQNDSKGAVSSDSSRESTDAI